jgi:homoserine kinase
MPTDQKIIIHSPATVANLVCGFRRGWAWPWKNRRSNGNATAGRTKGGGDQPRRISLPTDPAQNTAGAPLLAMIGRIGPPYGF